VVGVWPFYPGQGKVLATIQPKEAARDAPSSIRGRRETYRPADSPKDHPVFPEQELQEQEYGRSQQGAEYDEYTEKMWLNRQSAAQIGCQTAEESANGPSNAPYRVTPHQPE
jgi:hypothetical protein